MRPFVIVVLIALSGCVSMPPPTSRPATVLFSVMLRNQVASEAQPAGLVVGIDDQQVGFAAETQIPGQYTSFLVRFDLPAGAHRMTHVAGVSGTGDAIAQFDVMTDMPFEVKAGTTSYLGHIELKTDSSMVLADAYESDLPKIALAWPRLRAPSIERHAPDGIVAIASAKRPTPVVSRGAAARLDATAAATLPARSRAAFQGFLKSSYPRAFAVAPAGHFGTAVGGQNVIARALQNCRKKQLDTPKAQCQLFALDDTLISTLQAADRK